MKGKSGSVEEPSDARAKREHVERVLDAHFGEPSQIPTRLPSAHLLESVRRQAHQQLRFAFAPDPVARGRRIRDVALAALMATVTAVYVGWALTSVANLYR